MSYLDTWAVGNSVYQVRRRCRRAAPEDRLTYKYNGDIYLKQQGPLSGGGGVNTTVSPMSKKDGDDDEIKYHVKPKIYACSPAEGP